MDKWRKLIVCLVATTVAILLAGVFAPMASKNQTEQQMNPNEDENHARALYLGSTHEDMAMRIARTSSLIDGRWWPTLSSEADTPDGWSADGYGYNHYADTGAQSRLQSQADQAKAHFLLGQLTEGYQHLAWASHYMMDLANPYHADGIKNWGLGVHALYENWVKAYWTASGYNLYMWTEYQGSRGDLDMGITLTQLANQMVAYTKAWRPISDNYLLHGKDKSLFVTGVNACLQCAAQYTAALYNYVSPMPFRLHQQASTWPYAEVYGVGDSPLKGCFVTGVIHLRVCVNIAETYGDTSTDYLRLRIYDASGSWSAWMFSNLPQANGGNLYYETTIDLGSYYVWKIDRFEVLWHQWTGGQSTGRSWTLKDTALDSTSTVTSRVTANMKGFGFQQISSSSADVRGRTFGYDSSHSLGALPVVRMKLHLELTNPATTGDTSSDYLYLWVYNTDGSSYVLVYYDLPRANGGTAIYDRAFSLNTPIKKIDYFEFLWHQTTSGSWSINSKSTIYWDYTPSSYWY